MKKIIKIMTVSTTVAVAGFGMGMLLPRTGKIAKADARTEKMMEKRAADEEAVENAENVAKKLTDKTLEFYGTGYDLVAGEEQFIYYFEDGVYRYGVLDGGDYVAKIIALDSAMISGDVKEMSVDATYSMAVKVLSPEGELKREDTGWIVTYYEQVDGVNTGTKAVFNLTQDGYVYGASFYKASPEVSEEIKAASERDRDFYGLAVKAVKEKYEVDGTYLKDISAESETKERTVSIFEKVYRELELTAYKGDVEAVFIVRIDPITMEVEEIASTLCY